MFHLITWTLSLLFNSCIWCHIMPCQICNQIVTISPKSMNNCFISIFSILIIRKPQIFPKCFLLALKHNPDKKLIIYIATTMKIYKRGKVMINFHSRHHETYHQLCCDFVNLVTNPGFLLQLLSMNFQCIIKLWIEYVGTNSNIKNIKSGYSSGAWKHSKCFIEIIMISLYDESLYSNLKYDTFILSGDIKATLCTLGLCLFYGRLIVIPLETWLDIFWGLLSLFLIYKPGLWGFLWVAFNWIHNEGSCLYWIQHEKWILGIVTDGKSGYIWNPCS